MTDRRQRYVVVLTLLMGFVAGFLYTTSYSRLMVTKKPPNSSPQSHVIDQQTVKEDIKLQVNTSNKIELTFPKSELKKTSQRTLLGSSIQFQRCPMDRCWQSPNSGEQLSLEITPVSGNIFRQGMWEGNLVRRIHDILKNDPDVVFLDIGANVGVFSLTVAKLGRHTVSVDALRG